jgi:hypothetical protein
MIRTPPFIFAIFCQKISEININLDLSCQLYSHFIFGETNFIVDSLLLKWDLLPSRFIVSEESGGQQVIPFSLNVYLILSIESLTFKEINTFWKFKS